MKRLMLSVVVVGLTIGMPVLHADTSPTNMNFATSVSCPPGKANCAVSEMSSTSAASSCFTPGSDATKTMNATLDKLGYGHPSSIAIRNIYQIAVQDPSNKQQTLFFDFDPDTGNLIAQGTISN